MTKYVLTYHGEMGGMPEDPAEVEQVMAKWGAWYGQLGEAVVDGGAPFGETGAVGPDGGAVEAPASLTGYTIVEAADLDAARAMAKGCPVLDNGHTVQISEAIDMG